MIEVFSGTPGSGKSMHLARCIREQLNRKEPRLVIANFPLGALAPVRQRETYVHVKNVELTPELVKGLADDWWRTHEFGEEKIWLCLDEVQVLFNSREWSSKGNRRMDWLTLFSESRKYGLHVVFCAQNMEMIDRQFRMLVEYDTEHQRVKNMSAFGWLLSLPFGGRLVVTHRRYVPTKSKYTENEFRTITKRDMLMFDSYAKFARADGGAAMAGSCPT